MILLHAWTPSNGPKDEVVLESIESAFSSIKSLSRQKDMKETEQIITNRRDVLDLFAHLIGKISQYQFSMVLDRFYHELDLAIDSNNIPEAAALLSGIRYLRLGLDTEARVDQVRQFLDYIGKHINKKSKPELLASCCQLYGDVLLPLCNCKENPQVTVYPAFREYITEKYHEYKKLWKKLKEPTPGLTMEVGILCVGQDQFLASQPFSVLERLSKLAKVQDRTRPKILECTYYLLSTHSFHLNTT